MISVKQIAKIYEYFIRIINNRPEFDYFPNPSSVTAVETFFKLYDKEYSTILGKEFIYKYFAFQFNRWYQYHTNIKKPNKEIKANGVLISWIIGKKAFETWKKKPIQHYWYFVEKYLLKDFPTINQKEVFVLLGTKDKKTAFEDLEPFEEREKRRFFNTVNGLSNCLLRTTLFNSKSMFCRDCTYNFSCRDTLKMMYPSIYEKRSKNNCLILENEPNLGNLQKLSKEETDCK